MKRRNIIKAIALGIAAPPLSIGHKAIASIKSFSSAGNIHFESEWNQWPDMEWVGSYYWGNRMQDWIVRNGKVECLVSEPNRTLYSLIHEIIREDASFECKVIIELINKSNSESDQIGFRIGSKGKFEDYRSAAVFGVGLDAGVTTEGILFIGEKKSEDKIQLPHKFNLSLQAYPDNGNYSITLSVKDLEDQPLAHLNQINVDKKSLMGCLALISNFNKSKGAKTSAIFSNWVIKGSNIQSDANREYGPICFAQYTLHRHVLKLTAQLAPINLIPGVKIYLQLKQGNDWQIQQEGTINTFSRTAHFRIENWSHKEAVSYRILLTIPLKEGLTEYFYQGSISSRPLQDNALKVAVFSCNCDYGFPDSEVVENVELHKPDVALFLGDQFYESTGGFGIQTSPLEMAMLDYLRKWYMFGWSYRDIFRNIPAAIIPDDHDVYHGNVWGEEGKVAPTDQGWGYVAQDKGGYKMPVEWLNAVQITQTSHLPDAYDPHPVKQGLSVYYTNWNYGGVSFAILEDRKFKSAPLNVLPNEAKVMNGFIQNPDFDIKKYRDVEANLLGDRQTDFLKNWVEDWSDNTEMKVVLSQTNFCTLATLPKGSLIDEIVPSLPIPKKGEYVNGDAPTVDMDSNGWPQKKRDEAVSLIRKCFAFHIAGDQHLASVVRYGVTEFGDSCFAFSGPALNNLWPRRWWPEVGEEHLPIKDKPKYTGNFSDGFGNKVTVYAVASPHQTGKSPALIHDRATGYGIVIFDKSNRTIKVECWPRYINPIVSPEKQFEGWPVLIHQRQNFGMEALYSLPEIIIKGGKDPVIKIYEIQTNELIYSIRIKGDRYRPRVFTSGTFNILVGFPEINNWKELKHISTNSSKKLKISFTKS